MASLFVSARQCAIQDSTSELEGLNSKQAGQITRLSEDSAHLENLLKKKDKEIEEIQQSLKSLRDSLKVKKIVQ